MSDHRTKLQRESNELDMDIFKLIQRMEEFSFHVSSSRINSFVNAIDALKYSRASIRAEMHPDDIRSTS